MGVSPGHSPEEVREFVYQYQMQPHGQKLVWLAEQGVSYRRFERWRRTVFEGDVERGLIPRKVGSMNPRRRHDLTWQNGELRSEIERLHARIEELEHSNDVLGKAIGLLHQLNEQEPDDSPMTNDPSSSSTRKTDSSET